MLLTIGLVGTVIFVVVIGIALGLGPVGDEPRPVVPQQAVEKRSAFFVAETRTEVQMEILLARLEQHVRQERAAVEGFHDEPSAASLRCSTTSPLN